MTYYEGPVTWIVLRTWGVWRRKNWDVTYCHWKWKMSSWGVWWKWDVPYCCLFENLCPAPTFRHSCVLSCPSHSVHTHSLCSLTRLSLSNNFPLFSLFQYFSSKSWAKSLNIHLFNIPQSYFLKALSFCFQGDALLCSLSESWATQWSSLPGCTGLTLQAHPSNELIFSRPTIFSLLGAEQLAIRAPSQMRIHRAG